MQMLFDFLRLPRCQKGNVFVLVAVTAIMIIASTGAAVDMARAQVLQIRIQSALDAAGLAAGANANSPPSPLPSFCGSSTWVQCEAQKYFNANFPTGYLGSGTVTVTATLGGTNNTVITLAANTVQSTTFIKVVGINSVNVAANSQITITTEGMELVLVLDNTGSMKNPVNSSDSSVSKISAVQSAINGSGGLLDILYGSNDTIPNFWVGVVPFSQAVNIGLNHPSWVTSSAADFGPDMNISGHSCQTYTGTSPNVSGSYSSSKCSYTFSGTPNFGSSNWAGCVMARSATTNSPTNSSLTLDASDDLPSASVSGTMFTVYDFPYTNDVVGRNTYNIDPWVTSSQSNGKTTTTYNYGNGSSLGGAMGPNALCPTAMTQMTASKSTIETAVTAMTAGGSTAIDLGMSWGFRMLSPTWASHWGGEMDSTGNSTFPQLPLPYHTALMNKVLILMTDGMNEFDAGNYIAYQYLNSGQLGTTNSIYSGASYSGSAEQVLDNHTLAICNALKNNGVIIYTIGFGTDDTDNINNSTSVNGPLLKSCATQNYTGDTSHYFLAPTNAQLSSAFQQIAGQLANLRVSQ